MRIYRASSLGYSFCQLVAGHLGYEAVDPPEWLQEKFDEGHRLEAIAIEKLRSLGWDIDTVQPELNTVGDYQIEVELEVIPGKAKVVGHIDGLRRVAGFPSTIVEVKSMAHKSYMAFARTGWHTPGLVQKYKWQASAYMLATGMPHYLVAWDKETSAYAIEFINEPFYAISDIANKLAQAEEAIEAGFVPEGCTDYPCPYYYLHNSDDHIPPAPAPADLESIMAAWLEADKNAKIYEKEKKVLREEMIKMIGEGETASPIIKGACGVEVRTYWQDGGEVISKRTPKWVTKVQGPKNG